MRTIIKKCACGKDFLDTTRNHSKTSCCRSCTNKRNWKESDSAGKYRLRFNNTIAHGGILNDNEKEEIIDKLQTGVCDLCHEKKSFRLLVIDHDHDTGKYRGVICSRCNILVGFLEKNKNILEQASDYLKQYSK